MSLFYQIVSQPDCSRIVARLASDCNFCTINVQYWLDWIVPIGLDYKEIWGIFLGAYGVLKIQVTHEEWLNEIMG